jgi:hypothetical protein
MRAATRPRQHRLDTTRDTTTRRGNQLEQKRRCYTDKKENKIFLIYKEILSGAVAKSYMTNGLLIYGEIFAHFLIYWEALDFATAPL